MDHRWRPELFREANLVLLTQILTAQHNDEILVPGVANLREHARVDVIAQIDAENLGPECQGQRPYAQRGRRRLDLAGSGFHPFAPSRRGGLAAIMIRRAIAAQGSLASTRMKAMRQGSVPRLTQA